jgi:DNA-binding CsgD family transcriptional regulator
VNDIVKAALTAGEARVAIALLDGLSNREIAQRLGIGERSVKSVLRTMFLKYRVELPFGCDGAGKRIILARQLMCA